MHVTDFFFYKWITDWHWVKLLKKKNRLSLLCIWVNICVQAHFLTWILSHLFLLELFAPLLTAITHCLPIGIANTEIEDSKFIKASAREGSGSFTRLMAHLKSSATPFFSFVGRSVSLTKQGSVRTKVRYTLGSSDWAVHGARCRKDFAMLRLYYALPRRPRLISK